MKAENVQDGIPSISSDNCKNRCVLVFDLTSLQDATENFHFHELVRVPLRLEVNFTFPLEHVTGLIVLRDRKPLLAVDKLGIVGKNI